MPPPNLLKGQDLQEITEEDRADDEPHGTEWPCDDNCLTLEQAARLLHDDEAQSDVPLRTTVSSACSNRTTPTASPPNSSATVPLSPALPKCFAYSRAKATMATASTTRMRGSFLVRTSTSAVPPHVPSTNSATQQPRARPERFSSNSPVPRRVSTTATTFERSPARDADARPGCSGRQLVPRPRHVPHGRPISSASSQQLTERLCIAIYDRGVGKLSSPAPASPLTRATLAPTLGSWNIRIR